jgi:hypothetical protein
VVVVGATVPVVPAPVLPAGAIRSSCAPAPVVPEGLAPPEPVLPLADPGVEVLVDPELELPPVGAEPLEPGELEPLLAEVTVAEDDAGQPSRRSAASWLVASASAVVSVETVASAASSVDAPSGLASASAPRSAASSFATFAPSDCTLERSEVSVAELVPAGIATG